MSAFWSLQRQSYPLCCWALYGFLAKRIVDRYDTFLSTRKLMFYGIITSAPFLLLEKDGLAGIRLLKFGDICGLLYLSLICSAICFKEVITWGGAIGVVLVVGGMLLGSVNVTRTKGASD